MTVPGRASSPRPNRKDTARRERGRNPVRKQSKLQLLIGTLIFLAVVASVVMIFTDSVPLLRVGTVAALWAAVVGAIAMTKYRKDSENDAAKTRDLKLVYELQLEREIAARREYELVVETQVRRQVEEQVRIESNQELLGLRHEIASLRSSLEALFDGELPDERTALRAESHRLQELAGVPGRLIAAQAADLPPIDEVTVAADAEGFEPDYEGYRQASQTGMPGIADVDDDPLTAETQILSAEDIVAQGYAAQDTIVQNLAGVGQGFSAEDLADGGFASQSFSDGGFAAEEFAAEELAAEEFDAAEFEADLRAQDEAAVDEAAVDEGSVDEGSVDGGSAVEADEDADDADADSEHSVRVGGSSVADLMARLQANGTLPEPVGGRRRRSKD